MTDHIEAGLFAVVEDRTIRGLLVPYNEVSSLSANKVKPIQFAPGTIDIPRDPSIVSLNEEHARWTDIGRATALDDTDAGIVATFRVADTDEGDAFLADMPKRRLSAELTGIVRRGVDGIRASLRGAAVVSAGAFASAGLFALGDVTDEPDEDDDVLHVTAPELPEAVTVTTPDAERTYTPSGTTTEADTSADEEQENANMSTALAPSTAVVTDDSTDADKAYQMGANAVFAAMNAAQRGDSAAETMLAALSDIKISGTGSLPATGVLQPDWVGEVWKGRAYQRKFITLGTQGIIRAMDAKGYRLTQGTALVKAWAGNKAELPSGTASTALVASTLDKFGYAADIAREFFDLPGGEVLIAAFWAGVVESYARISDEKALEYIISAAGTPIAPDTYPTEYAPALGMLMQGILEIEDKNDTPTFAIMNTAAWKQAIFTAHEKIPEFVKFDFGTSFEGSADGFRVVRGNIGIDDTPAVLVGSKHGIRFNELATTPVQFDALEVAKGGVDRGIVGYLQTLIERPDSFALIGAADTP